MKIIIDTREQSPFLFNGIDPKPETIRGTLKTGDYSVDGFQDHITIERKSLIDLFGSCGNGRDRLEKEFQRMAEYRFAAFVVESDWYHIYTMPPNRSKMNPKNILRTLLAWQIRYGVAIWACPGRPFAEKLIYLMLKRFYDDIQSGKIILSTDNEKF